MYLCQSVPFRCTQRYQTGYNYDGGVIVSHCRKVYCFWVCQAVTHSVSYYSLYHCLAVTRIIKCHQTLSNSIYSIFHWSGLSAFYFLFSLSRAVVEEPLQSGAVFTKPTEWSPILVSSSSCIALYAEEEWHVLFSCN